MLVNWLGRKEKPSSASCSRSRRLRSVVSGPRREWMEDCSNRNTPGRLAAGQSRLSAVGGEPPWPCPCARDGSSLPPITNARAAATATSADAITRRRTGSEAPLAEPAADQRGPAGAAALEEEGVAGVREQHQRAVVGPGEP